MLSKEYRPASYVVIVRHLARFQCFFEATIDYTQRGDIPGMLLCGYLADTLHNVPAMLWNSDPNAWCSPESIEEWITEFPTTLPRDGAPQRLVEDCQRILSTTNAARTLQLQDDLSDLNLAPVPAMYMYLSRLKDACLQMRFMRNYASRPPARWQNLEQGWAKEVEMAEAQAISNEVLASIMLPIPRALVYWSSFDEEQFRRDAIRIGERMPDGNRIEEWIKYSQKNGETKSVD